MNGTHPGGRPKGAKTKHRHRGVFKKCDCAKWTKCRHTWHMTFRHKGPPTYRLQLDKMADRLGVPRPKTPSEAARVRFKVCERILNGEPPDPQTAAAVPADMRLTMQDLVQPYLDYFANQTWRGKPRRPHRVTRLANQLALICRRKIPAAKGTVVSFGDVAVADLTTPDIEAWREAHHAHMQRMERERVERAKRIAAGDAEARTLPVSPERPRAQSGHVGLNRNLEVIRQWLNWAIKKGHREAENPFYRHGVEIIEFTDEFDRTRRLLPGEEDRLLKACQPVYNGKSTLVDGVPHLYDLVIAALESGCRKGELLSLQWADVKQDKDKHLFLDLRASTTKTNDGRVIPVSPRLAARLEMRRYAPDGKDHPSTGFVFGNSVAEAINTIKTSWTSACKNAGIEDLHFHDLRREAGSRWIEGGINLLTTSKMLGHASVSTTDRYLKPSQAVNEREMREYHRRQQEPPTPQTQSTSEQAKSSTRVH